VGGPPLLENVFDCPLETSIKMGFQVIGARRDDPRRLPGHRGGRRQAEIRERVARARVRVACSVSSGNWRKKNRDRRSGWFLVVRRLCSWGQSLRPGPGSSVSIAGDRGPRVLPYEAPAE
jgi:hypothetical protein